MSAVAHLFNRCTLVYSACLVVCLPDRQKCPVLFQIQKIARTYLVPNAPCRIDAPIGLREQAIKNCMAPEMREMPWQMRELQKEAMDDLKYAYREFVEHETRSFFNAAVGSLLFTTGIIASVICVYFQYPC